MPVRIQAMHRPSQRLRRFLNDGSGSGPRARGGGTRVGEVIVDLPAHSLDLFADRRGQLTLAGGGSRSASRASSARVS